MRFAPILLIFVLFLSGCTLFEPIDENATIFKNYNIPDFEINDTNNVDIIETYNYSSAIDNNNYIIGSFNIESFEPNKANSEVMLIIEDIINDYDIIAIQGIIDTNNTVIDALNNINGYSMKISQKNNEEQKVFMYNNRVLQGVADVYPNEGFKYNPYVMNFVLNKQDIVLIQVNINSENAEQEIRKFPELIEWTEDNYGNNNIFIMGNLYADTPYFDSFELLDKYIILINETTDTTIGRYSQSYSRILTTEFDSKILYAGVDNLTEETNNNKELLEAISNQYPVYFIFEKGNQTI